MVLIIVLTEVNKLTMVRLEYKWRSAMARNLQVPSAWLNL